MRARLKRARWTIQMVQGVLAGCGHSSTPQLHGRNWHLGGITVTVRKGPVGKELVMRANNYRDCLYMQQESSKLLMIFYLDSC
jgi:hypothetical protein